MASGPLARSRDINNAPASISASKRRAPPPGRPVCRAILGQVAIGEAAAAKGNRTLRSRRFVRATSVPTSGLPAEDSQSLDCFFNDHHPTSEVDPYV